LHKPRIIILDDRQRFPCARYSGSSTVAKQRRHPSLLHTSREARAEGLGVLRAVEGEVQEFIQLQCRRGVYWWRNVIFLNFAVDVFHLKSPKQAGDPLNGSVNAYNFEPDLLCRMQHFALIYSTEVYYKSWALSNLLKGASI
jgi:hypothetical protein